MTLKLNHKIYLFLAILAMLSSCDDSDDNGQEFIGAYFNEPFPPALVTRFAPEVFTEELHAPPIFSPEGDEVYWSLMNDNDIFCMEMIDGIWSDLSVASFSLNGGGDSPFISSDGTKMLFLTARNSTVGEKIWSLEKTNGEWGSLTQLSNEVNYQGAHWQASMADNQNLYFGSEGDIYFAEYVNGNYTTAQNLGAPFNTETGHEGSPFIAPDESYLIFDRADPYADLFISFKQSNGSWGEPVNMRIMNSNYHELYANVSPDGQFIMFLSGRSGGLLLPFWIDVSVIENYRDN